MHHSLWVLAPELLLIAGAAYMLMAGLSARAGWRASVPWVAVLAPVAALLFAWGQGPSGGADLPGIRTGELAWYIRLAALGVGTLAMLGNLHLPAPGQRGEHLSMILFSMAGLSLVGMADDLVTLFLALELTGIPTYILTAGSSSDARAQEAGMKYLFLGALASALLVYGFSFLYGAFGTCAFARMQVGASVADFYVLAGMALAVAGLAFKITAVPLNAYALDVYEGAAPAVTGWLAFAPKLAGFVALIRLLSITGTDIFEPAVASTQKLIVPLAWLLWAMAVATMTVGNCLALAQNNVRRILACSSIAHSGYVLVAAVAFLGCRDPYAPGDGGMAMLYYLTAYGVINLGAFLAIAAVQVQDRSIEGVGDLAGLVRQWPLPAIALGICLLGLMGMPPTAGFIGKVFIFSSALTAGAAASSPLPPWSMTLLVIIGLLNAAVGAAYYLRIIGTCFLGQPCGPLIMVPCHALRTGLAVCAVLALLLGLRPNDLARAARDASRATGHVAAASPAHLGRTPDPRFHGGYRGTGAYPVSPAVSERIPRPGGLDGAAPIHHLVFPPAGCDPRLP